MTNYKINLTDISGVGPKTAEKIREELADYRDDGESWIAPVHLFRGGGAATSSLRDAGVGSDVLESLRAVGRAVHGHGPARVEARYLTGDLVADAPYPGHTVRIDKPDPDPATDGGETDEKPDYSTDRLVRALDAIREEYPEGYQHQVSFEADVGRFMHESDGYDGDDQLPMGVIQSVVRYRHDAETVEAQGDFETDHKALLVDFGESL